MESSTMDVHPIRKIRVYLIIHSQRYLTEAEYWLSVFVWRVFGTSEYKLVVVDNASRTDVMHIYAGDNASREFSGWDAAIQKSEPFLEKDLLVFANDSFFRNYPRDYLYLFGEHSRGLGDDEIVGWVDVAGFTTVPGKPLSSYIRTNLFAMSGKAAMALLPFCSEVAQGVMLSSEPGQLIERDELLTSDYLDRIEEWLISDKPKKYYQHKWYRATELTPETKPELFQKARCVINEHQLSLRAISHGMSLVAVNTEAGSVVGKIRRAGQRLLCFTDEVRWRYCAGARLRHVRQSPE